MPFSKHNIDERKKIIKNTNRWCDDRLRNQEESPGSTGKKTR